MHMADALLSPAVGGVLWAASATTLSLCSRRLAGDPRPHLVPLMGVLGAFVFAAQMINFAIPGTGSSGHVGGGLLLAILLGPAAAFVVIASVLTVQALLFADGGLLALGANIFNLGVFPCFVAYALVYRPLAGGADVAPGSRRVALATVLAAVVGLQLGSLGVVLETRLSGISALPLLDFLLLMQPIHLAIGLVEGIATASLVVFLQRARPDLFARPAPAAQIVAGTHAFPTRIVGGLALLAALTAGLLSWLASPAPDGLEWSIARTTGGSEIGADASPLHASLAGLQQSLAPLPDYKFTAAEAPAGGNAAGAETETWPAVDPATSLAGIVGGLVTLALVTAAGALLRRRLARVPDDTGPGA